MKKLVMEKDQPELKKEFGDYFIPSTDHEEYSSQAKTSPVRGVTRDVQRIYFLGHIGSWRPPDDLMKFLFLLGEPIHSSMKPKSDLHAKMSRKAYGHVLD
ncbi:hypothetical protein Bca4012_067269 [Brassica carinata]|uniref:Uncharacterized protein n=1 Tax=Brassica carinata TaxID=52824 RepID=A0A8X7VQX6_BRACI|nr:hypothetical protein Bca52824_019505 [Brassica carinata]